MTTRDIDVRRPALGIPPKFKPMIIGKECKEDIVKGQPLFWNNF
ncbi:MAG: SAF domain-containing protein [Bacteroides fragilis]